MDSEFHVINEPSFRFSSPKLIRITSGRGKAIRAFSRSNVSLLTSLYHFLPLSSDIKFNEPIHCIFFPFFPLLFFFLLFSHFVVRQLDDASSDIDKPSRKRANKSPISDTDSSKNESISWISTSNLFRSRSPIFFSSHEERVFRNRIDQIRTTFSIIQSARDRRTSDANVDILQLETSDNSGTRGSRGIVSRINSPAEILSALFGPHTKAKLPLGFRIIMPWTPANFIQIRLPIRGCFYPWAVYYWVVSAANFPRNERTRRER